MKETNRLLLQELAKAAITSLPLRVGEVKRVNEFLIARLQFVPRNIHHLALILDQDQLIISSTIRHELDLQYLFYLADPGILEQLAGTLRQYVQLYGTLPEQTRPSGREITSC